MKNSMVCKFLRVRPAPTVEREREVKPLKGPRWSSRPPLVDILPNSGLPKQKAVSYKVLGKGSHVYMAYRWLQYDRV